ncbi:MAG: class I SAM-dependent methyltransferase [Firmicutes bacterium]|nr:class I SAM-dependent methyltransferase [Bacillota bacterium]
MSCGKPYENPLLHAVTGETIRPGGLTLTERALEYCAFPPGAHLLDVGCGLGATVEHLTDKYKFDARGVDPSALLLAQKKNLRPDLQLLHGRAEDLPVDTDSIDGVICECTFSLLPDQGQALGEFWRVLKNKGFLIISDMYVKNLPGPGQRHPAAEGCCLAGAKSIPEFILLLQSKGFELIFWEDHSNCLAVLTAKLILADFPLKEFFPGWGCDPGPGPGEIEKRLQTTRLGYFLLGAKKRK